MYWDFVTDKDINEKKIVELSIKFTNRGYG